MTVVRVDASEIDSLRIARRAMSMTVDAVEDAGGSLGSRFRLAMDDLDALISRCEAEHERESRPPVMHMPINTQWAQAQRAVYRCDPDESAGLADVTPLDTWSRRVERRRPTGAEMEYQEMHAREQELK